MGLCGGGLNVAVAVAAVVMVAGMVVSKTVQKYWIRVSKQEAVCAYM